RRMSWSCTTRSRVMYSCRLACPANGPGRGRRPSGKIRPTRSLGGAKQAEQVAARRRRPHTVFQGSSSPERPPRVSFIVSPQNRNYMRSQVRFAMHPEDEREVEQLLVSDESIRFIAGPRWKTETPETSRSLAEIGYYCIIWSTSDIAKLKAEYIPSCDDWY